MIPRFVSETAEQLANESPVNYAVVIIYFLIITIVILWIINCLFKK